LFCTVAVVAPDQSLQKIGFYPYTGSAKQGLFIALLLSTCLLCSHIIFALISLFKARLNGWVIVHRGKRRLKDLTRAEKEILKGYIKGDTMTQTFACTDGAVLALEYEHIIYRASELSQGFTDFPFNIQPWAGQHLKRNPRLLS
jgi:hypothetical protein